MNLWTTFQTCKTYRCLPSQYLGIVEQPTAYFLDRAVSTFGTRLEAELEKVSTGKKKSEMQIKMARTMVLNRWLGLSGFADPSQSARKPVRVNTRG